MAPRLLGSLAAFAAFPVYLAMRGAPTALEVVAFAWLIAPILLSWFLSRTGRYDGAHVLSSLALAGFIMMVAAATGGIGSFVAVWLVVIPLEAALSASRRVVAFAFALAMSCAALLIALGHYHMLPEPVFSPALHSALMDFSGKLDRDKILEIAVGVGIDRAQLEKDMEDPKIKEIIDRNMSLASSLGVRGTPAFVIGKQFVPGAVDASTLKELIAEARKGQG